MKDNVIPMSSASSLRRRLDEAAKRGTSPVELSRYTSPGSVRPPVRPSFDAERSHSEDVAASGPVRADSRWYPANAMQALIARAKTPDHALRLNAVAMSYDGAGLTEIAERYETTEEMVGRWITFFNEVSPHSLAIRGRKFGKPEPTRRVEKLPEGYDAQALVVLAETVLTRDKRQVLLALAFLYRGYSIVDTCLVYGINRQAMNRHLADFRAGGIDGVSEGRRTGKRD